MFKEFFHKILENLGLTPKKVEHVDLVQLNLQPGTTNYWLNDPSTPDLMKVMPIPTVPTELPFDILGWHGGNVDTDQKMQAANCQVTLCKSIENIQSLVSKFRPPIKGWTSTPKLSVMPRAGQDYNAYYDRYFLKFFFGPDPVTHSLTFTADAADVVSHELGHALLDCMRPDFWSTQCMEIWAFHEAWGDVNAMMTAMQHDEVINKALTETGGNLRLSNTISRLAEQFGMTIYHLTGGRGGELPNCLRDAVNNFTYVKPEGLPNKGRSDVLINEPHSFGRLWVGVWYDIFVGMYEAELKAGKAAIDAIKSARDTAGYYLLKAIPVAPATIRYYDALARAMLAVDKTKESQYQDMMTEVFTKRGILVQSVKMLSATNWDDVKGLLGQNDHVMKHPETMTVRTNKTMTLKLSDHVHNLTAMSVSGYDLTNLDLTVPADSLYVFDKDGNLVDEIQPNHDEIVAAALACVQHIHENQAVGDGPDTEWEVKNNALVRTHIKCPCGK